MDKDYVVTKSNILINCNYDLSLHEQKIILILASMVQPQDTEFKPYKFKIKEFLELLDINDPNMYIEIPKITKGLMKKVFEIREGKKIIQIAWLCSAIYETGEGTVTLKFAPDLKPYMLELKELYTSYKLGNVLSLRSKYSIRMYEILRSNLFKKQVDIELGELRDMVGAKEKSYEVYQNVKKKVVIKAQEELAQKTDISFEFEELKTGRKVSSLRFHIGQTKGKIAAKPKKPNYIKEIHSIFTQHTISDKEARYILKDAKNNIELIRKCYTYSLTKKVDDIVPYMRTIVKNFYPPKANVKVDNFTNYPQREYDFDDLERKLLGWDKLDNKDDTE